MLLLAELVSSMSKRTLVDPFTETFHFPVLAHLGLKFFLIRFNEANSLRSILKFFLRLHIIQLSGRWLTILIRMCIFARHQLLRLGVNITVYRRTTIGVILFTVGSIVMAWALISFFVICLVRHLIWLLFTRGCLLTVRLFLLTGSTLRVFVLCGLSLLFNRLRIVRFQAFFISRATGSRVVWIPTFCVRNRSNLRTRLLLVLVRASRRLRLIWILRDTRVHQLHILTAIVLWSTCSWGFWECFR